MRARPVQVVAQRHDWDCGVAALSMLLRTPYGDVIATTKRLYPVIPRRGLGIVHLEVIAEEFGKHLKRVYKSKDYLLDRPTGILGLNGGEMHWSGHWVMMKEGVIIEPWHERYSIYGLKEYLQETKSRPATLLVLEEA